MPKVKKKKKPITGWKKRKSGYAYFFMPKVAKRFGIKKILFAGFKAPPIGLSLYASGGGFNMRQANKIGGSYFLDFLRNRYKKETSLTVFKNGRGARTFKILKKTVVVKLQLEHFQEVLKDLGNEIKGKKEAVIQKRLANYFPKEFKDSGAIRESVDAKLSGVNLNDLQDADHETIATFIKNYINLNSNNDEVLERLQTDLVIQGKKKTLEQVIKKFERHLKNKSYSEKKWQSFLHKEVFYFLSNYVESIREANVNFGKTDQGEKKPDFVWIDIYGFLDVFEIKTPYTDILAKRIDKSHKNYYFSTEASKAIAQIEKYMLFLEKNVEGFENYLSRKTSIPFSVLKPKAFLIIGKSKELEKNADKKKDFRLLRRLFKNIEFITFDELLDNLKNLASKFDKVTV